MSQPVETPPPSLNVGEADLSVWRFASLYKMLLDSIPSSVLLLDSHLRIVSANRNFLQKARVTEAQILGEQLEKVFPPVIYQHMNLQLRVADVFRTGQALKGERLTYRAPGLSMRVYYYSLVPFQQGTGIENVMLLMEDVTDKIRLGEEVRRAERHLASVVESASDMVLSMDTTGRILTWNPAARSITGFEEKDVRNRNLRDYCSAGQMPALARILHAVFEQGRTEPVETEMLHRAGHVLTISWVFSSMRDEEGRVAGIVAVGRDLTERRKWEAKLVQSEKLAALGVMAGGIAHEIRNPLAVVSSAAQLLLQNSLSQQLQGECAERIHRNVQRVSGIVESLLRFARPADSDKPIKTVNLVLLVEEAKALVLNQARLAKTDLRTVCREQHILVQGNSALLQQLVTNLVLNALNAIPETGGEILISVEKHGKCALLRVADTGRGISEAHLSKVFDPFFTTMPVGKGTGLGLSISYAIVEQHKGKIDIASREGKGTTVTVSLPLEK